MTVTAAEAIEQLQRLDPSTEIVYTAFAAKDFVYDDEPCTDIAFRSAVKNSLDEIWEQAYFVIEDAVYAAMGWEEEPADKCANGCVCGGSN